MSGITSTTGLISGIDTGALIQQLISIDSRPKTLIQQRIISLQAEQAAFIDLSGRLNSIKTAASSLRTSKKFESAAATSSNPDALTATAKAGASPASYTFVVDRLVSTQRLLSRGYADKTTTATGLETLTLESAEARLDRDTELGVLNGGSGVRRGKISITDSSGASATVDLSRTTTVSEVLKAINEASGVNVKARVEDNHLVIDDLAGGVGTTTVADLTGGSTAADLGIAKSGTGSITGNTVYALGDEIALAQLNDGRGVLVNQTAGTSTADFTIATRDGSSYDIDIGNIYDTDAKLTTPAARTVGDLKQRIEDQTEGKVTLSVAADGLSFQLVDSSVGTNTLTVTEIGQGHAAEGLGLLGTGVSGTLDGKSVFAHLNSTLAGGLAGGSGLTSGAFSITARDGQVFSFDVTTDGSVSTLLEDINDATGGAVTAALSDDGVSLVLTDTTGGTGNLIVTGQGATELGVATDPAGVAKATVAGSRLQRKYIGLPTLLSSLNAGQGVGTGSFEITDSTGKSATVTISSTARTIDDVIRNINSRGLAINARINDHGDGIIIEEDTGSGPTGGGKIAIKDTSGTVAKSLHLTGTASGTGADNYIDGSFERTITFKTGATLADVSTAINDANAGVRASIVADGGTVNPFRLSLTSNSTGRAGRLIINSTGSDPGFTKISEGENARVFFGSSDPAQGLVLQSTTNAFDGVVDNVSIDIHTTSKDPVELNITRDVDSVVAGVQDFVNAYNDLTDRIDTLTAYDADTEKRGTLLGNSAVENLRRSLLGIVLGKPDGVSGQFQTLASVGVTIGEGGKLQIDDDRLRSAIETDAQGVRDLFSARSQQKKEPVEIAPGVFDVTVAKENEFTSLGIAEKMAELINKYTNSVDGLFTQQRKTYDTQIQQQNDRITDLDARLADKQARYEAQFAAMESALANLQRQQAGLGGLQALLSG